MSCSAVQTTRPQVMLRCGAAQADITPQPHVQLMGDFGGRRLAEHVLDPLYVRVLVLQTGQKKLCFVSLDVTIVTRRYTDAIRRAAASVNGLEADAVMVHATQTHTAPSLGHILLDDDFDLGTTDPQRITWIRGGDEEYGWFVIEQATGAIRKACENLRPVEVGAASGYEGRIAFNRRAVMRDGTVSMPWYEGQGALGPIGIRYMEGPIDPEVGVVAFRSEDGNFVSCLLNYACHPVNVFPSLAVSADWPGAWADELRQNGFSVPLVLNGCCGDVNPWPAYDPEFRRDHLRMGRILARMTGNILRTMTFERDVLLDFAVRRIRIPLRKVDAEQLKSASDFLAKHPAPLWEDTDRSRVKTEWMMAAGVMSVHLAQQRDEFLDYEIQVLRIGDTAFVGLPGEPFAEGGLRIKMASPAALTYVVHCTSQYAGYLPTKQAVPRGGHEGRTSSWVRLVPEALDMVVDAAGGLLRDVFMRSGRSG